MELLINGQDEIKRAGNLTRSDHVDGLAMSLVFEVAVNDGDKYWPKTEIKTGDKVILINDAGKLVFSGMVTDVSKNTPYIKSYTAYDYGWNLNKNEVVVQFRNMSADAAITKLCSDFAIPVGKICAMPTKISKVYNGTPLSDCLKDIIKQTEADTAKSYRLEVRENKLYVEPYSDLIVKTNFKPADNLAPFDPMKHPANVNCTESIADLFNSIKMVSAGEQSAQVIATAKDEASIVRYGLLQKVEQMNDRNKAQIGNMAKNLLLENNKVTVGGSITFLGDDAVRSGRIVVYQDKAYLVKSCTHHYGNGTHTMDLTLEAI